MNVGSLPPYIKPSLTLHIFVFEASSVNLDDEIRHRGDAYPFYVGQMQGECRAGRYPTFCISLINRQLSPNDVECRVVAASRIYTLSLEMSDEPEKTAGLDERH